MSSNDLVKRLAQVRREVEELKAELRGVDPESDSVILYYIAKKMEETERRFGSLSQNVFDVLHHLHKARQYVAILTCGLFILGCTFLIFTRPELFYLLLFPISFAIFAVAMLFYDLRTTEIFVYQERTA